MARRTRKHKKRVRRKTRRKGRRRRRRRPRVSRRRRRRRQRGGSEDYDALRKEMFQAVRLHKETGEFPSPSAGQLALFDPTQCPNPNYRDRNLLKQQGETCWMWSVVLLLLNLSSPPISFPLNTLVKTYLIHLEYLLKSTFDGCPMIPGWLRAVASEELRNKTALAASFIENTRFSAGVKERMEAPIKMRALSFLLLLLKAAGYTVKKNVQYFDGDAAVLDYSPSTVRLNNADGKPSVLVAVLLLSDFAGKCTEIVNVKEGGIASVDLPNVHYCIGHDDCAPRDVCLKGEITDNNEAVEAGLIEWRRGVALNECWEQRKGETQVLSESNKVKAECKKKAQRQVFAENVLWRWLFTKNAEKVLGGLLSVRWMNDGDVMRHSMAFYRCVEMGEVRIYICNTWGGRCSRNNVNAEEFHDFLGDAFWGKEDHNVLITSITCIVAEKMWWSGTLTPEERRINALGERARQELLEENE